VKYGVNGPGLTAPPFVVKSAEFGSFVRVERTSQIFLSLPCADLPGRDGVLFRV
jgi:hypothetical protein